MRLILLITLGVSFAAGLALPERAWAYPSYVNSRYGLTELPASYTSYECTDCHLSSSGGSPCGAVASGHPYSPCFNSFGIAYRTTGWSNALRDADADGDGISNGDELSDSFADEPIGSAGIPAGAEAWCDLIACAAAVGASIDCGGNIRCEATRRAGPASTGSNPTSNNYTFAFTCEPGTAPLPDASDTSWDDRCLTTCGAGYITEGAGCRLVDACAAGTDDCVPLAECMDAPGTSAVFTCACPSGYAGNGRSSGTRCTNINECAADPCGPNDDGSGPNGNGCRERALSAWTAPGYDCSCAAGYATNGTTCVVATECITGAADCVSIATCLDPTPAVGDFTCTCPTGYAGDGRASGSGCTDIDECASGADVCGPNEVCVNNVGTPNDCVCAPGYRRATPDGACEPEPSDGGLPTDGGSTSTDASATTPDAESMSDAGGVGADAAIMDAGGMAPDATIVGGGESGCSCRAGSSRSGSAWYLAGLALALLTRRGRPAIRAGLWSARPPCGRGGGGARGR